MSYAINLYSGVAGHHSRRADLAALFGFAAAADPHYQTKTAASRRKQRQHFEARLDEVDIRRYLSCRAAWPRCLAGRVVYGRCVLSSADWRRQVWCFICPRLLLTWMLEKTRRLSSFSFRQAINSHVPAGESDPDNSAGCWPGSLCRSGCSDHADQSCAGI